MNWEDGFCLSNCRNFSSFPQKKAGGHPRRFLLMWFSRQFGPMHNSIFMVWTPPFQFFQSSLDVLATAYSLTHPGHPTASCCPTSSLDTWLNLLPASAGFLLHLLFDPEHGCFKFLWNAQLSPNYTTQKTVSLQETDNFVKRQKIWNVLESRWPTDPYEYKIESEDQNNNIMNSRVIQGCSLITCNF